MITRAYKNLSFPLKKLNLIAIGIVSKNNVKEAKIIAIIFVTTFFSVLFFSIVNLKIASADPSEIMGISKLIEVTIKSINPYSFVERWWV